jgi:hypothetical protein
MTWANASAMAEEARRQIAGARLAETAASDRPRGEIALALLAMIKTLLVLIALVAAVTIVGHPSFS